MKTSELDKVAINVLIPKKACSSFSLLCSYCQQGAVDPLPQEWDWSSEDWEGTKAKASVKGQNCWCTKQGCRLDRYPNRWS